MKVRQQCSCDIEWKNIFNAELYTHCPKCNMPLNAFTNSAEVTTSSPRYYVTIGPFDSEFDAQQFAAMTLCKHIDPFELQLSIEKRQP